MLFCDIYEFMTVIYCIVCGWQNIQPVHHKHSYYRGLKVCLSWVKSYSWASELWKNGESAMNINIYKWIHAYVRFLCLGKWERYYISHWKQKGELMKEMKGQISYRENRPSSPSSVTWNIVICNSHYTIKLKSHKNQFSAFSAVAFDTKIKRSII